MKCHTCLRDLDVKDFYKRSNRPRGRFSACKECCARQQREYRKNNTEKGLAYNRKWRKELTKNKGRITDWLKDQYENVPCLDCGGVFPWPVMDWDHIDRTKKRFIISVKGPLKATPERMALTVEELTNCELVCANCHRIRTHNIGAEHDAQRTDHETQGKCEEALPCEAAGESQGQ